MSKRILVASIAGLVLGVFCWLGGVFLLGNTYTSLQITNILINRTLTGFVIGISTLRMRWWTHGLVLGFITGLPFVLYDYLAGYGLMIALMLLIVNPIYGLIIEFFTTRVVNEPVALSPAVA